MANIRREELIKLVLKQLDRRLKKEKTAYQQALETSINAASAMQSHHDTTKEEMAKLADAYQEKIQKTKEAIDYFKKLTKTPPAAKRVSASSLVVSQEEDQINHYFIAEHGGGLEVERQGKKILIVSPQSPIGQALVGQPEKSTVKIRSPASRTLVILNIG